MGKAKVEAQLARLHALRPAATTPEARDELRQAMESPTNLVVAKAAGIVGEFRIAGLEADLEKAFFRFLDGRPGADKGCAAAGAVAKALYELGVAAETVFLRGIHHVQMESGYGGPVDAAVELRSHSALGLVRMGYRHVMTELADLLADPVPEARMAAARAIAYAGRDEGRLLLRLKLLGGDREARVMDECLTAMVRLGGDAAVPFVGRFLGHADSSLREGAALALGESRRPEAMALLLSQWDKELDPAVWRALAIGLALLRHPQATDFLLTALADAPLPRAAAALDGLSILRSDPAVQARVRKAVARRDQPSLTRKLESPAAPSE